jgi:hypothetical protein
MRRRWVLVPVLVIAGGVAGFWFEGQSHKPVAVNGTVDQSAVLTVIVRSTQDGNTLPLFPITIQRTDPMTDQAPAITTLQSNGSGMVTTPLPFGRYTIRSAQSSRYVGTASVDLRENSTIILRLFDRTASSDLNTNAS